MFFLRKPSGKHIQDFKLLTRYRPFSYYLVGVSALGSTPSGYASDHNRIELGHGPEAFERAKAAIREWKMFDIPWVQLCWPKTPIQKNQTVAILVRHFGFWSLNATRIVYVIDEPTRFGFAYGTLQDHAESGEERFCVEMLPDGSVWYDLYAFSRPRALAAKLGYPIARSLQHRFARDSLTAMQRSVAEP